MSDIVTVIKRELKSIFSDRVIMFQIILLPFMLVFGYAILMSALNGDADEDKLKDVVAYSVNAPEVMSDVLEDMNIKPLKATDMEDMKTKISKNECDLIIKFPEDFKIDASDQSNLSNVMIWYNSSESKSMNLYAALNETLNKYQPIAFTINADSDEEYDLGDPNFTVKKVLGTILPIMILMSVFTVCMNIAAESIAGDKERGFLNTMLITPVSRRNIAAGKAFSLFIISIIGGFSAFLGMILGLPKIAEALEFTEKISYSVKEYIMLFIVTITAVFALSGMLLVISSLAQSVKQATSISPVFMIIITILSMIKNVDSFSESFEKLGRANQMIPIWNSMDTLQKIIEMDFSVSSVLITCAVNTCFAIVSVIVIGKIFENDNIVNG